jgi:hypothetical protein
MVIVTIHAILGLIILILAVIASIVEIVRGRNGAKNPLRGPLIGLLDLQILLGIVTIIWTSHYGWFLVHPIIMVVAAILFHGWTKASKSASTRIPAYVISTILLIVGAVLFY